MRWYAFERAGTSMAGRGFVRASTKEEAQEQIDHMNAYCTHGDGYCKHTGQYMGDWVILNLSEAECQALLDKRQLATIERKKQ